MGNTIQALVVAIGALMVGFRMGTIALAGGVLVMEVALLVSDPGVDTRVNLLLPGLRKPGLSRACIQPADQQQHQDCN